MACYHAKSTLLLCVEFDPQQIHKIEVWPKKFQQKIMWSSDEQKNEKNPDYF